MSALLEARRYGAREALMLLIEGDSSLNAYKASAAALGLTSAEPNAVTGQTEVSLRLGWVKEY